MYKGLWQQKKTQPLHVYIDVHPGIHPHSSVTQSSFPLIPPTFVPDSQIVILDRAIASRKSDASSQTDPHVDTPEIAVTASIL